jgi:lysosomal Pro-X carboxypeptidase
MQEGLITLTERFRLCKPLQQSDVAAFVEWLSNAYIYLAMVDYPYPTSFLQPLPGWPLNVGCSQVLKYQTNLLEAMYQGPAVFYNTSGTTKCMDISPSSIGANVGLIWFYQACTEMTVAYGTNGVTDMFPPNPFSVEALTAKCQKLYGVTPRVNWIPLWAGGWNITASSNIIFSNGRLDPWCNGGILHDLSDSLIAIVIDKAAHHLDLRFSEPEDPVEVTAARVQEGTIVQSWLNKYYQRLRLPNPLKS